MRILKAVMGVGIAVGMLSSTVAMAAETRSGTALPHKVATPVKGVRTADTLKKKSAQTDTTSWLIPGVLAAAAVGAGIYFAVDNNDDDADSAG